jgi:hypothetical protein
VCAAELFRPGTTFEATRQNDGSIRLIELVEKEVPVAKVIFHEDGSFECPPLMTREQILATIRADRDANENLLGFLRPH